MGVARLLAKGWLVFCAFAGAHAIHLALARGEPPLDALQEIGVCILLFAAMGLLFIAGFGLAPGGRGGFLRDAGSLRWARDVVAAVGG